MIATGGDAQATVAFSAPYDGGANISSYTATSNPGGVSGSCAASPCTVMGLTNGTTYTFTVTATNVRGTGNPSLPSNAVVPEVPSDVLRYVEVDHLDTPRQVSNGAGTVVWRWESTDAFGANLPNEDPDGDAIPFVFNLRMPGQYADKETRSFYNYFRDGYDPAIGRYNQSNPIGLRGGLNIYAYVGGNPVSRTDPYGLYYFQQPWQAQNPIVGRANTIIPPGGTISSFIEKYVPAGRTLAEIHDPLVDALTGAGWPDVIANKPTMPFAYIAASYLELLRFMGLVEQPKPQLMCTP